MNNVELSEKIKGYLKSAASKAKKFEDTVAVTVSLISEENEDMYVAVREGKILVAPYRYDDNGCAIEAAPEIIDKIFAGELAFLDALDKGFVKVKSGDVAKFKALEVLVPAKKAAAKAPAKKAEAKPAAKAEAKPAAKAEAKPAVKTEAKPAVKTEAKPAVKTEAKPAVKTEAKPAVKAEAKPAVKAEAKPAAHAAKNTAKKK